MEESYALPPQLHPTAAPHPAAARIPLTVLWAALPPQRRQEALQTLSRIVQRQLAPPPPIDREVRHDDR